MGHYPLWEYTLFIVILMIAGLFAGFVGSFFGVGGGTILVPSFLIVYSLINPDLSIDMHQAVAASLALTMFNTFSAARKHHHLGNLPFHYFKGWAIGLTAGSIIGGVLVAFTPSYFLKMMFTAYLLLAVIYGCIKRPTESTFTSEKNAPQGVKKNVAAVIIGGVSVLLGLAGGTFTTPFFNFFGYPIKKSMAIAVAGGVIIGFVGTFAAILAGYHVPDRLPFSWGYINIVSVVVVAPFVMFSSPWGVKLATRISDRRLHWLYVGFLTLLFIYLMLELTMNI
ncbi:MAG: hypothetical protein A3F17_09120 [Gammaproteobacteria bacterium RIFCSPHIGHO2_12_FULL_41_15]|nr:MAG: hypothetical protein A3F17_09120 [Gammaproteobacteria bacterium RIFCSPHIGHO2_12_FULL_41_15]